MLIKNSETHVFALDNFEGPLDFLLYLVQKNEIDVYNITLQKITEQYKEHLEQLQSLSIEAGAEFIGFTASLLWIKSKMLLPKDEAALNPEDELNDPEFAIIHQLLDYCRFKEIAKELSERENRQLNHYPRGAVEEAPELKRPPGIEHITLEEFASLFQDLLQKSNSNRATIKGEEWQVSDKIALIRELHRSEPQIMLSTLFSAESCRDELIVTFLAVLELMKLGEIKVAKMSDSDQLVVIARGKG